MHNNYLKDLERKLEEELEEFELIIEENILKSYPELFYAYTIYKYVMDLWNEGKWDPEW
jgi:predicted house-cleaning noncanonical NTP pyrophosphatase (MazG superfamily)